MTRPASIIRFEQLYLASFALWAINALANWSTARATLVNNPQIGANPGMAGMVGGMLGVGAVIVAGVSLLLWWLVARKASVVGKWLVVVTEGLGVLFALFGLLALVSGRAPSALLAISGLVATALAVAAAVMLFRPDADAWLSDGRSPNVTETFR